MKFKKGDEASFFKILLSDSEYLPLPSAFAKKYLEKGNNKKQNIILQTKSCVEWRVKYMRIEDRYYFMGGWLRFMKENHLEVGDFLVFWPLSRDPNPVFRVLIYSPNGCFKCATSDSGNTSDISAASKGKKSSSVESMSDDDDDESSEDDKAAGNGKKSSSVESMGDDESSEHVGRSLTRVIWKTYRHRMPLSNGFVNATGINGHNRLKLKNDKGKIWEAKVSMQTCGKYCRVFISQGWLKFLEDNKVKIGEMCKFDHVKGSMLHVSVLKNKKDL
ncbi:hypothetical protein SSX86_016234 [Deinandra increscens subsp. villosa]|uniref:TF-B3 domain-containing protein n=1 Tax=Deinandra increscens subsp. villosa TaxID=3103831 RepID=A0AAP0D2B6_9ASTR